MTHPIVANTARTIALELVLMSLLARLPDNDFQSCLAFADDMSHRIAEEYPDAYDTIREVLDRFNKFVPTLRSSVPEAEREMGIRAAVERFTQDLQ